MNRYYSDVLDMGGVMAGTRGEGRLRSPFTKKQTGDPLYEVFAKVKEIFDPKDILNPGVKFNTDVKDLIVKLRSEYNLARHSNHRPRN
jgi:FAD/FMN-containing dehydrogenase